MHLLIENPIEMDPKWPSRWDPAEPVATCSHVREGAPVLIVHRGEDFYQFMCGGEDHEQDVPEFRTLHALVSADPTLADMIRLNIGETATRPTPEGVWVTVRLESMN